MAVLKRWLFILVLVLVSLVALIAASYNNQEVPLRFLGYETAEWPISFWMFLAFVVGVLFGMLLNLVTNTRLRLDARRARKAADKKGVSVVSPRLPRQAGDAD
jgi:lipopolysaccharide assembly protein A